MVQVDDTRFQELIDEALENLPGEHVKNIKNIAILYEQDPTAQQREKLRLRNDQTLLGLYEGTPLAFRQGMVTTLPDRITLFKGPISRSVNSEPQLKEQIRHTLWHEIGHYYGLNHAQIHERER
jgi:predicted Zn-dependent protease with MMP-like domain